MKTIFALTAGLLLSLSASSQILKPVKWSYAAKKTSATEATVLIKATMGDGWHIYAQDLPEGGPLKTTFAFTSDKSFSLKGKVAEPKPLTKFEKVFGTNVNYFEKEVVFQQKIKLTGAETLVKGTVEFMICSDKQCLPPQTIDFTIPVS
jgi:DsbC/DsbD-like thiol-disulfide interchange protein